MGWRDGTHPQGSVNIPVHITVLHWSINISDEAVAIQLGVSHAQGVSRIDNDCSLRVRGYSSGGASSSMACQQ
jgi:hypothetical protein